MRVIDLINALEKIEDKDRIVIVGDSEEGWSNLEYIKEDGCQICIMIEKHPLFSDN